MSRKLPSRAPGRIAVSIDRLVLNGFDATQRGQIVAQLQAELTRLLADPVAASEIARSRHLPTLRIPAAPNAPASPAGVQAAASIVRGLRG